MKHIMFPTVAAADAFIADLQARGVVKPEVGSMTLNRRVADAAAGTASTPAAVSTPAATSHTTTDYVDGGGTAEDAGAGAVKGTVAGALTGAAAGVLGTAATLGATAATVATGGLALPVILGMAALGSGVGAAVGAVGGAAGVDETGGEVRTTTTTTSYQSSYDADDTYYNRINERVTAGGRVVAVDDNVPADVLAEAVAKHGGEILSA